MADGSAKPQTVELTTETDGAQATVRVTGALNIATVNSIDDQVRGVRAAGADRVTIDLSDVEDMDTSGAWIVHRLRTRLQEGGVDVRVTGCNEGQQALIDRMERSEGKEKGLHRRENMLLGFVANIGEQSIEIAKEARDVTAFLGLVLVTLGKVIVQPWKLRVTSLVHHMQAAGLNAMPITALLSVLIGVVLAFQGADQLERFGAEIFTVNLIAVSVLREIGVLMTSIIIAGRSGSAFTAQIGTMKVNQEVDAMATMGLDPIEVLVLPRVIGLMITLPLLVFFADICGLVGGGIMTMIVLDISPTQFTTQLLDAIGPWTFWVGMIKAPVFAFIIALIGCYEGLQVSGSAESVGKLTTKSVVEAIFLVIVFDAMFSILFSTLGI